MRGQVINKKMNDIQTSNMIKYAATSTDVRKQKIMDAVCFIKILLHVLYHCFGILFLSSFPVVSYSYEH
jgi:eukaryotic translation initiation factor 2C